MNLNIGYFYRKQLNLYGDTGNVEVLKIRSELRGHNVNVYDIDKHTSTKELFGMNLNLIFMGGGPDSGQKEMYDDLLENKGPYIKEYIENLGVGLFICGSYQLLGKYYKSMDGSILDGLSVLDFYTEHPGRNAKRFIGNVVSELNQTIYSDPTFPRTEGLGNSLVGFENHGGRTYLGKDLTSFATIVRGFGNNGKDSTEGVHYKNSIGTYLHGPVLSKNPHLADYLIVKSLGLQSIQELDDSIIVTAHTAARKLKQ
jgi:CobQ-like glutamine amidotransferase family enzyme